MHEKGGLYFDFENNPERIISRTVSLMVECLDTTSDGLPDYLLKELFDKTNYI
ncbi:hypothetical protein [Arenibacter sp. F20364]|uniref:hypothetical protein n=1 Tax=Arenibacter sp. F20364 TaxID=2926415 RepID=UPI001FF3B950|nr:hypothetical protein [Arenibacter sp. F20364]MCK0192920.1 hypothetical protein [Arenibacter sp. F20364]